RHTRSKRDWSSDVCSSDLKTSGGISLCQKLEKTTKAATCGQEKHNAQTAAICLSISWVRRKSTFMILTLPACGPKKKCSTVTARSEERRVGKESKNKM